MNPETPNYSGPLSRQKKVRCYGYSASLVAEATWLKESNPPVATVNLEMAPTLKDGNNKPFSGKKADWDKKLVFQLSQNELPLACAVMMGYLPSLHIKRAGKGIEIHRQPNKLFVRASAGAGKLYNMEVVIGDAFLLCALMLEQLALQSGIEDQTLLLAALRGAASLANSP